MGSVLVRLKLLPSDEMASNRLLRALWAQLRAEFGKLAWMYQPRKDGPNRVIYFGYADLALAATIHIGITYKKRGVIDGILFEDVFNRIELPKDRFEKCVNLAERTAENKVSIASKIFIPYKLSFPNIEQNEFFSILNYEDESTYLCLKFHAFDEADAVYKFSLNTKPILDVLSSFTNLYFALDEAIGPLPSASTSQKTVSALTLDWLDGYPITDGTLFIPEVCLSLIEGIICDNLTKQKQQLVNACHHFHAARILEEQSNTFHSSSFVEKELALVLYISCLEVLSLINAPSPVTCETCSQPQYRISTRVKDFMEKHNGPWAAKVVKELYDNRSKYLHTGSLLSSRSFSGYIIPQLDFSSLDKSSTRSPLPLTPLHNLREYTSFCVRAVAYELIFA